MPTSLCQYAGLTSSFSSIQSMAHITYTQWSCQAPMFLCLLLQLEIILQCSLNFHHKKYDVKNVKFFSIFWVKRIAGYKKKQVQCYARENHKRRNFPVQLFTFQLMYRVNFFLTFIFVGLELNMQQQKVTVGATEIDVHLNNDLEGNINLSPLRIISHLKLKPSNQKEEKTENENK